MKITALFQFAFFFPRSTIIFFFKEINRTSLTELMLLAMDIKASPCTVEDAVYSKGRQVLHGDCSGVGLNFSFLHCVSDCIRDVATDRNMDCLVA